MSFTMTKNKENSVWADFVGGDKKAFASIYNEHIDALFLYGSKICPDRDLTMDCIQDVFIDLFQRREKLSVPYNLKFYLFKVLKHALIKKLRKERKFGDLSEREDELFQTEYSIEKKTINEETERNTKQLLYKTLNSLTSKQQEILYLRFTLGFNYAEISGITKTDHNSVRKQVYRTIKKLRESEYFRIGGGCKLDNVL